MATGDGPGAPAMPAAVVSSSGRRAAEAAAAAPAPAPADDETVDEANVPLVKEADPEFERLLAEEEEIERNTRQSGGGAERFRPGDAD